MAIEAVRFTGDRILNSFYLTLCTFTSLHSSAFHYLIAIAPPIAPLIKGGWGTLCSTSQENGITSGLMKSYTLSTQLCWRQKEEPEVAL